MCTSVITIITTIIILLLLLSNIITTFIITTFSKSYYYYCVKGDVRRPEGLRPAARAGAGGRGVLLWGPHRPTPPPPQTFIECGPYFDLHKHTHLLNFIMQLTLIYPCWRRWSWRPSIITCIITLCMLYYMCYIIILHIYIYIYI